MWATFSFGIHVKHFPFLDYLKLVTANLILNNFIWGSRYRSMPSFVQKLYAFLFEPCIFRASQLVYLNAWMVNTSKMLEAELYCTTLLLKSQLVLILNCQISTLSFKGKKEQKKMVEGAARHNEMNDLWT